jgi:protein-disulfide isomerase
MKNTKLLLFSALGIACLFGLAALLTKKEALPEIPRVAQDRLVKSYSPSLGNPDAKVTVVEYLDPECESCAAFYPVVKGLVNDYKDRLRFTVRYMLFHGNSKLAALATEAAGKQGKYWEMQGQLFYKTDWTHQQTPQNEKFEKIAGELGLDLEKFKADMKDPEILANIENDFKEGPSLGVNGTPTIFVNGRILGELSYKALRALIDEELANNP